MNKNAKDSEITTEKIAIYNAVIKLFGKKGIKFTMDDLAKELRMSKKTLYVYFKDKETLLLSTVDYIFDGIKEEEYKVSEDTSLSTVEKLEKIMGVMPDSYKDINFAGLYMLKDKYPKIYKKVGKRLESGWEVTIALLEKGMQEGNIRRIPVPIFKTMFEATLEQFFQQNILIKNKLSYGKALQEVISILLYGVTTKSA
ncbi:MAG: TetR/AcrR family transcriptional regulator [Eubacterium sp.]|nr:TetR/AcrR family transcriptional regulator [Eubacterium sp.]MBR6217808.1 TetR/AcrR family transcriptional regulator [Eubacterium sp.]